ncbi:hypothetical protein ACQW5G_02465 [Fructilactobacillus sp. Tb1]|uniref:hypothetical protein n=1 Tax=Fructilactobacillus sp. Tb1 TaxID=3422304 RepID=UPI003D2B147F
MLKNLSIVSILVTIGCWSTAIYTFWKAATDDKLTSLLPVVAYNSPQGIFGWSISLAFILSGVSLALVIVAKIK